MVTFEFLRAHEVIEAVLPDANDRWTVMDRLIRSWQFAGAIAPAAISVTLKENGFRLNVGQVEALTYGYNIIRVLLAAPGRDRRLASLPIERIEYASLRGEQSVFIGAVAQYRSARKLIDPLHEGYIRNAATRTDGSPRRGTPHKASHSRELMKYAAGYLSTSPPQERNDESGSAYLLLGEIDDEVGTVVEGARTSIFVNAYERNREARRRCIAHWGPVCQVCDFNFTVVYGDDLGRDFKLPLELRECHEDVQGHPAHGIFGVEGLGNGDEGDPMALEQLNEVQEVEHRSG